jgi:hypothetical protein
MQTIKNDTQKTKAIRYVVTTACGEDIEFMNWNEVVRECIHWRGVNETINTWFHENYEGGRKGMDDAFNDFCFDHMDEALGVNGHEVITKVVML